MNQQIRITIACLLAFIIGNELIAIGQYRQEQEIQAGIEAINRIKEEARLKNEKLHEETLISIEADRKDVEFRFRKETQRCKEELERAKENFKKAYDAYNN